jgi:hypothetical protein
MLLRQADVGEVARYADVIGPPRVHVFDDAVEHIAAMPVAALPDPVEVSRAAFQVPVARAEAADRPQVHVGQVRNTDGLAHARH